MTNEISKELMCVVVRGGIEIWLEKERADNLIKMLTVIKESKFIEFNGQILNTADISGIFTPDVMEEKTRRKNGQWKCGLNNWHDRGEKCDCRSVDYYNKINESRERHYKEYGFYPLS